MKKLILITALLVGLSSTITYGQSEPPYGLSQFEAYALFYENYRTGDYDMALTFGQWMLEAKPREIPEYSSFALDTQFWRMIQIHQNRAADESDPAQKSVYLENAIEIFELTEETFEEDEIDTYQWAHRQGRFYHDHSGDISGGMQEAYRYYERAYEINPQRFAEQSDGYFGRLLLSHYVSQGEREKALAMIDEVEPHASSSLASYIEEARGELFSAPDERAAFLESRLADSDDPESILNELATLYDQMGNRERAVEISHRLYDENPSFENTRKLADMALSNAQYETALVYLIEAMEKSPNENREKRIALEISETYQNMDNLQEARNYARRALEVDGNFGSGYLQIASIYASAINSCSSGRSLERDDRTVYWLALDYLERAIEADPSTRATANRRINSYVPVMPSSEDKFFSGWETGDSFTIGANIGQCYAWINETTTVR